ncbi:hypothetical protein WAI453_012508 [Rhynchosporium graminicola]|uniref:Uncharacterized protein n=1 Tax=Rhynchosporium graminicola TaxID=2792576 RepID=A0A1E1KYC3_9HELO|nr:uncharacterized protein RCO7_09239 [Rhynchosporium commune]
MSYFEEDADAFLQEMLEASANVVDTFRDPADSPDDWSGAILGLTAAELSYLNGADDDGNDSDGLLQRLGGKDGAIVAAHEFDEIGKDSAEEKDNDKQGEEVEENMDLNEEDTSETLTTNQAWPSRIQDLPHEDAILVEIQTLMITASGNYDKLQGQADDLQILLNNASGTNGQLMAEIDRLNSLVKPLNDQLDTKQKLIEDLQKEVQQLTASENHWKKEAGQLESKLRDANSRIEKIEGLFSTSTSTIATASNEIATKQLLVDTVTAELATAHNRITVLEEKEAGKNEVFKALGAAQFESKRSTNQIVALEKKLKQSRIATETVAQNKKVLDELNDVKEENKKLRRANFHVVQDANKKLEIMRETNTRLVLKMNEPQRRIAFREAYHKLQNMPDPVEKIVVNTIEEKEGKEIVFEKVVAHTVEEKENRGFIVARAPGSWTGNDVNAFYGPSLTDSIANYSENIIAANRRMIAATRTAALHAKFTAKYLWSQWKHALFWMSMAMLTSVAFIGTDLFDQEPQVQVRVPCCKPKQRNIRGIIVESTYTKHVKVTTSTITSASTTTGDFSSATAIAMLLLVAGFIYLCTYLQNQADDRKLASAELALEAAVRADILAREGRKAAESEAIRRQWQVAAAHQPDFFESLNSKWTPVYQKPRKYWGNNL